MSPNSAESSRGAAVRTPDGPTLATRPTEPFGVPQRTARRTRRTVDLSPVQHRSLDVWQREAADRLGRARVTGQDVLSALVDQLLNDSKLANQIIRTLQARR